MSDAELLRAHAERIRASGVLGRSSLMQRLFDFLLERSIANRAPKEIEVAMDAFGKGADFDVSQDAMVRVYVHKLRRKLEEFYSVAGAGADDPTHLSIPKGEYRFVVETMPTAAPTRSADVGAAGLSAGSAGVDEHASSGAAAAASAYGAAAGAAGTAGAYGAAGAASIGNGSTGATDSHGTPPSVRRKWLLIALAASLLVNVAILLFAYVLPSRSRDEFAAIRQNPIWAPILNDDRNIFLVVGDYYIFGETDESMEVRRLVREFEINSPQDLEQHLKLHPEEAERYLDLELAYLPTAAAYAVRDLMPVLASANRRVRVVTMSQLNPAVIKSADVIYVGYLSGLGRLGEMVFRNSRLQFGDSFDEIVDRKSGKRYVSQAGAPYRGEAQIRDYGYFATFAGPEGNRIVVIAGMRDMAAMHMAETLTATRTLDALAAQSKGAPGYEALYEVYGMDRLNLDGKLLLTSPLDSERIWTGARYTDK